MHVSKIFTLNVIGRFIFAVPFLSELSEGSIRCASNDLKVVTLTTYCVTDSVFSVGGLQVTFSCFSLSASTSMSSGGLGNSSVKDVFCKEKCMILLADPTKVVLPLGS